MMSVKKTSGYPKQSEYESRGKTSGDPKQSYTSPRRKTSGEPKQGATSERKPSSESDSVEVVETCATPGIMNSELLGRY